MTEISDTLDYLTKAGFVVWYKESKQRILGGTKLLNPGTALEAFTDGFSIVRSHSGWVVRKLLGQLMFNIEKQTLFECADVVCKLYENVSRFDDDSMSVATALEQLKSAGLNARFLNHKFETIRVCLRETSDDCVEGISILRKGAYFVVVYFNINQHSRIVGYSESLAEAVKILRQELP